MDSMFEILLDLFIATGGISSIFIVGLAHGILSEQDKNGSLAFTPYGLYIYVKHTYEESGRIGFWFWSFLGSVLGLIGLGVTWVIISL